MPLWLDMYSIILLNHWYGKEWTEVDTIFDSLIFAAISIKEEWGKFEMEGDVF